MSRTCAVQSMTGFGRGVERVGGVEVVCEVRAVNARTADVRVKLPAAYRTAEPALRKQVAARASRGKIDVVVERRVAGGAALAEGIDEGLYRHFRAQLLRLTPELATEPAALAGALLRLPGVVGAVEADLAEGEEAALERALAVALDEFVAFRLDEGRALAEELSAQVGVIAEQLPRVEAFEAVRERAMRERLERLVAEKLAGTAVDRARLEQECLFYLDKMDIAEEKARLAQHCAYFVENLDDGDAEKGRRLTFIAQEMGREINTLGAKAYSSDIQRVVVGMKEALEKIKEQLANAV